ncbi:hypothetical protein PHAVU_009G156200 [Phaseolus vulgaris]|uniref:Uncharacterized protein n=1 Tax=Phaseolus vulgaris TaxID=3885 RepID=V7AWX1_PHAVU|nr:hypothetical protein PHAVU_009G156200g [Phaseolus vulgaris]ESW09790.1 hypothetical protein PHAVU_009G156200g [Phaseolus vulgaris]
MGPTIKCIFKPGYVFIKLALQCDKSKLKLETSPTQFCTVKPIYLQFFIEIAIQNLSKLAKNSKIPNAERESIQTNSSLVHVRSISNSPETIFNINVRSVFSSKLSSPFSVFYFKNSKQFPSISFRSPETHKTGNAPFQQFSNQTRTLFKDEEKRKPFTNFVHQKTPLLNTDLGCRKSQTSVHRFRSPENAEPVPETRMEEKCRITNRISVSLPCNDLILV